MRTGRFIPAVLLLIVSLFLLAGGAWAQSFDIIPVADGVYAAIGKQGVFCNGAFVVGAEDVLVVDTHLRPSWARDLIAEIRKITDKPVRYVVNTHWHGDHVQGNQAYVNAFGPRVEYLAQHMTRTDMAGKAIPSVQQSLTQVPERIVRTQKLLDDGKDGQGNPLTAERRAALQNQLKSDAAYLEELKQIQITLPTLTFERSLVLHKAGRTIHVLYFGKGHTRGDVVVFLPKEKVVITGDLLTNGIPFTRDSYPSFWAGTLESIQGLDWQKAIPGHGDVQPDKEQIRKLIAYMRDLAAEVKQAVGKGLSLEDTLKTVDLSRHAAGFPNFATANRAAIERAWNEASGKIQD